ncbi:polyprenyl synthetase [Nitzschia inconspicua]|uniref:Polyprenyl synthetase n=1 Tax=Nitzschia inconspicua TaxID=303405 RepID=A0A9K3KNT0_9STRA|nr:polyprenyl synthetase [Nitzschia inconspicua]
MSNQEQRTPTNDTSTTPLRSQCASEKAPASDPSSQPPLLPHRSDPALLESFHYINSMPGKNVRGKMIDCFQLWFQIQDDNKTKVLDAIKDIVGDLHNASLMIDDIEDNSKLRRGCPVAHSIFGIPTVINSANYAYFLALEKCHALQNPKAMEVFVGELLNLHRGQGHDILWRDDVRCPTEDDYLKMVQDKTGGLFRLAVGLMQAFATQHQTTNFTSLVNNLALYFQIRDDYINLVDEEYMKSKSFCEDLTEGKFSFPIIHCIRSNPDDHRLLSILKKRTDDLDVKRYAQQVMFAAGSMEYTRAKCISLKEDIVAEIHALGGNPPLLKLVLALDVQIQDLKTSLRAQESPIIDVA